MIEAMLAERTSITTVYFPRPVTQEQKAFFFSIQGLIYGYSVSRARIHTRANRAGPCKGWVEGCHEQDGRSYEMGIIWHFWVNAEMEKTFKEEHKVTGRERDLKVADKYVRELEEAGAERWAEVHCDFEFLPNEAIV